MRRNTVEDFWNKVNKTEGCWLWLGGKSVAGYGQIRIDSKNRTAHRVAYRLVKGEIPKGLQLDHLCRVRHCVNPEHLEAVTLKENVLRGEGITAEFKKATHCIHGHPFNKENTLFYQRRTLIERRCITCNRQNTRERRAKLKAMAVT
jgi:hypothetical protein